MTDKKKQWIEIRHAEMGGMFEGAQVVLCTSTSAREKSDFILDNFFVRGGPRMSEPATDEQKAECRARAEHYAERLCQILDLPLGQI